MSEDRNDVGSALGAVVAALDLTCSMLKVLLDTFTSPDLPTIERTRLAAVLAGMQADLRIVQGMKLRQERDW
jgi:hypothetical protein